MARKLSAVLTAFRPVVNLLRTGRKAAFSRRYLLYTNTFLSGTISGAGDLIQQSYQSRKLGENFWWDRGRTEKMAASGLVVGPFIHFWYTHIDVLFPGKSWQTLVKKLIADQLIATPVYIALFLVTIGILDREGTKILKEEFKGIGVYMYLTEFFVWTPAQAINFYFISPTYRVVFDGAVSLVVDTFFSYLRFDSKPHKAILEKSTETQETKSEAESNLSHSVSHLQSNSSEVNKQMDNEEVYKPRSCSHQPPCSATDSEHEATAIHSSTATLLLRQ